MCVMWLSGVEQEWIVVFRGIEYFVIGQICLKTFENKKVLVNVLVTYIIINSIIGVLQHFGLLGAFTSYTYLPSGHGWLERAYGLTGGPWEFGLTLIIAFHIIMRIGVSKSLLITLIMIIFIDLILADTRANLIAYVLYIAYCFRNEILKRKYILFILFSLIFSSISFKFSLRYENLAKIFFELANFDLNFIDLINIDLSLSQRMNIWVDNYEIWSKSIGYMLFGIGWHSLYMESFILRLIFSFGLLGTIFIIYLYRNIDKSILLITLISGLTLDIFLSMKIFIFYLIYAKMLKDNFYIKRNEKNNYICTKY